MNIPYRNNPQIGVGVAIGIVFCGGCLNPQSSVFFKKKLNTDSDPDPDFYYLTSGL
jgi:hypothetical protein